MDTLPLGTRQAMLKGLERNDIIVGADGNVHGGRCPMMAASVGSSKLTGKPFARAWDAYAGVRFARPATRHELQTLRTMLQSSIEIETEKPVDLTAAISSLSAAREASASAVRARPVVDMGPALDLRAAIEAHMASKERSVVAERAAAARQAPAARPEPADTGERDRTRELEGRHGWAWMRPFRRLDEFERAVQTLEDAERAGLAAYRSDAQQDRADVGGTSDPRAGTSDPGAGGPRRSRDDRQSVGTPSGGW